MSEPIRVTVFSKPGCTLCGPVRRTVDKVDAELGGLVVEEVDISRDPALMSRYGHEIPVVEINGRKAFKGHVTEQALKKRLRRERDHAPRVAEEVAQVEALEELEPPRYVPPRPIAALVLAATVAGFGYFVAQGVSEARDGHGRLAGALLRIQPRATEPVPFELESLDGRKVKLSDFAGKTVFVNFWATWCPPCIEEMPSMIRLYERMKSDPNFVVLAISADESWAPVKKFFDERGNPGFQVLLDPKGVLAKQYGTTMFPETYVVKNGKIVAFIEGPRDWDRWYAEQYLRATSAKL
ncbi:redoxin domain-containing protein [Myxococcota bacterium]|nr:redoxin domain-containing protein [Myxococcota bacterium]